MKFVITSKNMFYSIKCSSESALLPPSALPLVLFPEISALLKVLSKTCSPLFIYYFALDKCSLPRKGPLISPKHKSHNALL